MADYEAPTITELGSVADFTNGRWDTGFEFHEDRGGIPNGGNRPPSS